MARKKKAIITEDITRDIAEEYFAEYSKLDAKISKILADQDLKIAKIREQKQDILTELSEKKESYFDKLYHFAETNPDSFASRKSLEMMHGKIGFRTGTPKLKTLRGFTWASVTNLLQEFLPEYVRTKDEPNKELLIADRDKRFIVENEDGNTIHVELAKGEEAPEDKEIIVISDMFTKSGFECIQDETFFVEPKKEEEPV